MKFRVIDAAGRVYEVTDSISRASKTRRHLVRFERLLGFGSSGVTLPLYVEAYS